VQHLVYKVRSSHTNLKSAFTAESSLTVDRTAPTVNAAHIVFTGGPTPVADYVRSSGGTVEVYADVSDNCAAASALTVSFDLTALGAGTVAATPGSWTPIAGGPTYNYRATFTLTSGVVANAAVKSWSVTATDPNGNTLSGAAGTSVTGDGAGPVYTGAEMVSAFTNFYDATLGNGEIPSDGSARTSGSYVYANFTDASGVASVTANLAVDGIVTGGTAVPLTSGSYTTYDGTTWPWRSAATVINSGLADGNRTFTVTATDNVGNPPVTSASQTVEIDDTPFSDTTATCTNAGNANNLLASGDRTDFILGDTLFPGSVKAGWTGATLTASPILKNGGGNPDYFDLNTDFGLTLFQGTAYNQSWNLNATNWVTANTTYTGSSFTLFSRTTLRLSYQGASVTDRTSTAQASFGTSVRDAAGNPVTAAFTVSCTTTPW
jgi:hypothetical protein